jgi:hypothetical protein
LDAQEGRTDFVAKFFVVLPGNHHRLGVEQAGVGYLDGGAQSVFVGHPLLAGYGQSLWVNYLALPIFYMISFVLLGKILREEGLTWRSLLEFRSRPVSTDKTTDM